MQIETGFIDKIVMLSFISAEFFILIQGFGYIENCLRSIKTYKRNQDSQILTDAPFVEIWIPAFEEAPEVLEKTIIAAKKVDYPNYTISVLDDSEDQNFIESTKKLCAKMGINYIQEPFPRHGAKAGNLNEAIKNTKAKYLAIFDADYRPGRNFLKVLIPQMENDSKLVYIQTPQFYANSELSKVSKAAQAVQSVFFEYICEGKSVANAIFMCGTNFVLRSDYVKKSGGFCEDFLTEDFATSIKLSEENFANRYHNEILAYGDGPSSIEEYFKQQYRWAKGTSEVFLKNLLTLISPKSNLKFKQRMEFFLSGNYYFMGLAWLVILIVPPLFLLFEIPAYFASPTFYFSAYIPYFAFSLIFYLNTLRTRLYPKSHVLLSQSLTLLTLPIYLKALFDALLKRKSKFTVTFKNENQAQMNRIPWQRMSLQLFLISLNLFALWVGFLKLWYAPNTIAIIINMFWSGFHAMLMLYLPLIIIFGKNNEQDTKNQRIVID
jgi:cellulose synthase (UDP-forming)